MLAYCSISYVSWWLLQIARMLTETFFMTVLSHLRFDIVAAKIEGGKKLKTIRFVYLSKMSNGLYSHFPADNQTSMLFKRGPLQEVPSLQLLCVNCSKMANFLSRMCVSTFFIIPCRSYLVALQAISHQCCVDRKQRCTKTDGQPSAWLKMYDTCRQASGAFSLYFRHCHKMPAGHCMEAVCLENIICICKVHWNTDCLQWFCIERSSFQQHSTMISDIWITFTQHTFSKVHK